MLVGESMFGRIESISQAAVWDGYDGRTSAAPDFARYNLIYGWNASGKTTLSRVFGLLNGPTISGLPAGAHVRVSVGQGVLDSRKEQDRGQVPVRIFNRDFIDANLQQADYTHAPALFIVGEDNIRLSNRIVSLSRRRDRVAAMYRSVQTKQNETSTAREKAATDLARECGTVLGVRDFRAPNLKGIHQRLTAPANHLLDAATLQAMVSQARDQSEFAPIRNLPEVVPPLPPGVDDVAKLLKETPKQNTIKRLSDAPALSDWVRTGLRFHEHSTTCAFCGNDAAQALEAYANHFSDEYRHQHAAITAAIGRLEQRRPAHTFPHEKEWVPDVRAKVKAALGRLTVWEAREGEIRRGWAGLLNEKLANMETAYTLEAVEDRAPELTAIFAELHQAKDDHNRACDELAARRRGAAEKVKEHFAARFVLDPGAAEAVAFLSQAEAELGRIKTVGQKIAAQAAAVNSELQRSSVAASQINGLLKRLLGPRISVEQAQDNRIQFIREGQPAINMSDGERTAISLAYFLVSLGQNGQRLEDLVVFVDDPICSLDANHIYDVAYLLITSLKVCRQLFISTHNSEFFNTVKQDWADRAGKFHKDHEAYLVHRENDGASQLMGLPAHLAKFRSDYHHVFFCLRQFQASTRPDVEAYLGCPNLLRRFLEMYLGFKRPTPKNYLSKLDILFDDEVERNAVARYVDEGSHSASTLRLLEFSDFPGMSRGMVERVMRAMERVDPDHYSVLMAETA
ncbi:AAA family ATPase [Stenotrophomonas maltophilia group sp. Smal17]|uniref:AAA family ATPase n=1 Tax=Stenotrophomonas maltophilia group sp. Smal17 TaxID=3377167 RepID=UPI002556F8DB|nr:AAA family ATPase [Stenotrophomonas maltophilia]